MLGAVHTTRGHARICADTRVSVVIELVENKDGVYTTRVSALFAPLRFAHRVNGP